MKIIVDTNIVFSGILNSSGNIGRLLIHSKGILEFYSSEYLLVEIESHFPKLLKLTDLGSDELSELIATVTRDKKLYGGLLKKGVSNVMTTANLLTYLNKRSVE
ncbi:MAG: PIN domain-containing protein [Imperialibacter sp.]|uniref:PIN domain-containing protein n=1 Tax=Imperialibacter sp. TaxID=2038411 RepID=UPI0032EB8D66